MIEFEDVINLNITNNGGGSGGNGGNSSSVAGLIADDFVTLTEDGTLTKSSKDDFVCTAQKIGGNRTLYGVKMETEIKTVSFPNLVTVEGDYSLSSSFSKCKELTSISFPELVTINSKTSFYEAFKGYNSLTSVTFPKLRECAGMSSTFAECKNLTNVSFPELTSLGPSVYVFNNNKNLTNVSFPKLTTILGRTFEGAFYGTKVTSLDLPSLKGTIDIGAFYNCTSLQKIWIPKEVTEIKASNPASSTPFNYCSNSLVIYTDAPQRLEGWQDYWNYKNASTALTVVYGATHEEFLNA